MARRVGMTTELEECRQYWQSRGTVNNWLVVRSGLTYDEAQAMEKRLATRSGYKAVPGGRRVRGRKWSVYRFDY